jgi:hypothetical protein
MVQVSRREVEVLELFAEVQERYYEKVVRRQQEGYTQTICDDRAKRRWREANRDKQKIYAARHVAKGKAAELADKGKATENAALAFALAYIGPPLACVLCRGPFATKESLTSHWWAKHREQQAALSDTRTAEQLRRQLDRLNERLAPLEQERDRLLEAIRQFGG